MDKLACWRWDGELTHLQEDRQTVRDRMLLGLQWLKEQYTTQGWQFIVEPEDIVDTLIDEATLLMVGPCIVGFSVEVPWFLTEPVIGEEFIMFDGNLTDIVAGLEAVGKQYGACRLVVGTRAVAGGRHVALARLYSRQGFSVSTLELTKEIT